MNAPMDFARDKAPELGANQPASEPMPGFHAEHPTEQESAALCADCATRLERHAFPWVPELLDGYCPQCGGTTPLWCPPEQEPTPRNQAMKPEVLFRDSDLAASAGHTMAQMMLGLSKIGVVAAGILLAGFPTKEGSGPLQGGALGGGTGNQLGSTGGGTADPASGAVLGNEMDKWDRTGLGPPPNNSARDHSKPPLEKLRRASSGQRGASTGS